MRKILAAIDLPPVWLIGHLAAGWVIGLLLPPMLGGVWRSLGAAIAGVGLLLMALAVWDMARARTTVIPRRTPSALVTTGVFAISRNPIYLGDALVLFGVILWWDAILALPVVASFVSIITSRFIRDEEARLTESFGPEFDLWAARVRRWVGRK